MIPRIGENERSDDQPETEDLISMIRFITTSWRVTDVL